MPETTLYTSPSDQIAEALFEALITADDRELKALHARIADYEQRYPRSVAGMAPAPARYWNAIKEAFRYRFEH
jgi:hypothetical protein